MFWVFYSIGGIIAVLIFLKYFLPLVLEEIRHSIGIFDFFKVLLNQVILLLILSCVAFFASWISIFYLIINHEQFKD